MKRALPTLLLSVPLCLGLTGCGIPFSVVEGSFLGLNAATIPVIHRDLPDVVVSSVTGRDCSIVRLDRGQRYCKPPEAPPSVPPYCTRSIGVADCWFDTTNLGAPPPRGIADGQYGLTPEQEADRTRWWSLF